jgi:hypothetical protein
VKKNAMHVYKLEQDLDDAKDRAEFAEETMKKYRQLLKH